MRLIYAVHILTGSLCVLLGYVALYTAKGAAVHRRSGMLFVYAMVTMATVGMTIAIVRSKSPDVNIPAGLITSYMVITALTTVRPAASESRSRRRLHLGGMLVALAVGVTMLVFGLEAIASGGRRHGVPAFPYFMFTTFALLGVVGDLRVMRSGALRGTSRVARHLWRMSVALLIASLSVGQIAKLLAFRIKPPLLLLPALVVAVTMLYWLWRVRFRRSLRGVVVLRGREPVAAGVN